MLEGVGGVGVGAGGANVEAGVEGAEEEGAEAFEGPRALALRVPLSLIHI